jgi:PKD repeat protein
VVSLYNEGGGPAPPPGENEYPVADLSAGEPYEGSVNSPVFFNGSESYDPDGVITEWRWTFGDATTGSGEAVQHQYSTPGTFTVILTVVDVKGAIDTDSTSCVITEESTPQTNTPPNRPTISGSIYGSKNVGYDFTVVSTDADFDAIRYFISWGDQSPDENTSLLLSSGAPHTFRHRWTEPGIYTVTAWASDGTSASPASSLTIFIDVKYTGDLGFLINEDGDGLYDRFFCNSTKKETSVEKQESGLYLIDCDGDGSWDHSYNPATSMLSLYTPRTPGFELMVVLCAVAGVLVLRRLRRRDRW